MNPSDSSPARSRSSLPSTPSSWRDRPDGRDKRLDPSARTEPPADDDREVVVVRVGSRIHPGQAAKAPIPGGPVGGTNSTENVFPLWESKVAARDRWARGALAGPPEKPNS